MIMICYYNKISILPPLPPRLGILDCGNNELTELTCLPTSLIGLYCSKNFIKYIDKFPDICRDIRCADNLIEDMPVFPKKLHYLQCSHNKIKSMYALPINTYHVDCSNNLLETLPYIRHNIVYINCDKNPITEILDTNPNTYNFNRYVIIKENMVKLYKFKLCYYLLKYKQRFRELLWERIRKPKIMALYSPENIQNTMLRIQDDDNLDAVQDQDIVDRVVISIENGI
jgi:Leucine-rich repeat (LRR) protein